MKDLISQIQAAVNGHSYYLALYASLTLPDICGAMESDDGQATGAKYIAWFDKYVAQKYFACVAQPEHESDPTSPYEAQVLCDREAAISI